MPDIIYICYVSLFTMKDRIRKVIDYKNITAGELAARLGVQRSNISHVLNGRNKPGASFLESFLNEFPEINARWLLTGHGDMLVSNRETVSGIMASGSRVKEENSIEKTTENIVRSEPDPAYRPEKENGPKTPDSLERKIDRIVVLYTDKTFVDYKPG